MTDTSARERAVDEKNAEGLQAIANGDRARGARLFAEAVALARATLESGSIGVAEALYNRATHPPEGMDPTERARDLEEVVASVSTGTNERARVVHASACHNLAVLRELEGAVDEARELYGRALALREALLGPDHPRLRPTIVRLAQLEHASGRTIFALTLYERALVLARRELGPDHREVRALEAWRGQLTGEG